MITAQSLAEVGPWVLGLGVIASFLALAIRAALRVR